jgi:hypothetical protein
MMEPGHVNKTSSYDFACVAARGNVCISLRGLDDFGQELLAERG